MIPVTVMDEHNDAYYHWICYIEHKFIPPAGNYLLHIDHHDDFEFGGYDWDLNKMPDTPKDALDFVDRALGIADFIAPTLWQGIFSTVHIMKNLVPRPLEAAEEFVRLTGGTVLTRGKYIPFIHAQKKREEAKNYRFYTNISGGLGTEDRIPGDDFSGQVVLDVDLDYFCWDDSLSTAGDKRMEITKEAYVDYMSDRNHPFRLFPIKYVKAAEHGGRYYLEYKENRAQDKRPDDERIIKRMDRLFEWFVRIGLKPSAIDVCRSSYSGYLPRDRADFVEREFMKRLKQTYDTELLKLSEMHV